MADDATEVFDSARPPLNNPAPIDFVRSLGRQLPRSTVPEDWVKRTDRRRVRKFKEKTLGSASLPKHEAQKKLS